MSSSQDRLSRILASVFEEIEPTGRLVQLLDYWKGLRPGELPRRPDIDLSKLSPSLLPGVFLVDVLDNGQRFRWRLIGSQIIRMAGTDDTGLDLEIGLPSPMRPAVREQNRRLVTERRPLCHRGDFVHRDLSLHRYERLMLPVLSADGSTVDTILGLAVFETEPHA